MSRKEFEVQRNSKDWWFACVDIDIWNDKELSTIDKAVFTVICIHANFHHRNCNLKIKTMAEKVGCSIRSVQNSMKKLVERGLIQRQERFDDGKQVSSRYIIIGHNAPCYKNEPDKNPPEKSENEGCNTCIPRSCCTHPVQEVHPDNDKSFNNINNTLTREKSQDTNEKIIKKPEKLYEINQVPETMKQTAEYLLLKTKREGLTWEEISALRTLNASHYPSRVQKEIDTAIQRFERLKKPLHSLTFCYIAQALKNQRSLKPKNKAVKKHKTESAFVITSDDVAALDKEFSEEEILKLETEFSSKGDKQ